MDDFVVNVRQIGQYPRLANVGAGDLVLLQQGGVGGPYATVDCATLVETALQAGGSINLAGAQGLVWPNASFIWGGSGFYFSGPINAPTVTTQGVIIDGELAATQDWVGGQLIGVNARIDATVWAFNGRAGMVFLNQQDVYEALCLDPCDPLATQSWVNNAICTAMPQFLYNQPLVYTWNGRVGDVFLTLNDVECAFFACPGVYPTAPSPALGDASNKIATTAFVDESLSELLSELGESGGPWAPINSPQFTGIPTAPTAPPGSSTGQIATTSYVMHAVQASTTGVASFNGRTGNVSLTQGDIVAAQGWDNVNLTGVPVAPTAAPGTNSTQIASTAFVRQLVGTVDVGVTTWNGRTGTVTLTSTDVQNVGGVLANSPTFTGTPTAPTAAAGTNSQQLATTAFVANAIAAGAGVVTWNGRAGTVTLQANDLSAVGGALLSSPAFSGTPTAPTANPGNNSQQLATTAFVAAAVSAGTAGVSSFNTRTGAVTLTGADITGAGGAPANSPALTGTPTAPTAGVGTNNTQIATTAFVASAISAGIGTGTVTSFNSRVGAVTLQSNDVSAAGGALLVSPTFSGTPAAPTATTGTSTTQLATTQFVNNQIAATTGSALLFQGSSPPSSPTTQSLWLDTTSGHLYTYNGTVWSAVV